jgi:hypothetical protein
MTGRRASITVALLVVYAVVGSVLASAQTQDQAPAAGLIHFGLSAQPLGQALDAYEHIARQDVLIDGYLLRGRMSAPVEGEFTRSDALRQLLAGTGLEAHFTGANAAVVVLSSSPERPSDARSQASSDAVPSVGMFASDIDGVGDHVAYAELVQSRLTDALCQSPETRPGAYRMVVQLNIDASGAVIDSKVAGPSDPQRKAAVARIARGLVLGEGPPAGLGQPITILLRPLGNGIAPGCPQSKGSS